MRQVEEQEFMTEWSETRIKIEDWLSNADSQAAVFEVSGSNIIEVEEQVAEHEVIIHLILYRIFTLIICQRKPASRGEKIQSNLPKNCSKIYRLTFCMHL